MVPRGAYRLPGAGRDGVLRRRGGALVRLLHCEDDPVTVGARVGPAGVRLRSEARSRAAAAYGLDRMRFALGLDHDLTEFHRAFRRDPLLGAVIRRKPWLRPRRRAEPFEALAWAVCEQLIEAERAFEIQRRIVWRLGRRSPCGTLRDVPAAAGLGGRAPAELDACGLAPKRSIALVRAAREVASGRADLDAGEPTWQRLRRIPNVGAWTLEKLALHGQGRDDLLPAGDLAYLKLVGSLADMGRRASEEEVRDFFAPYAPFEGLAGLYALSARSEDHRGRRTAPRRRRS